MTTSPHTTLLEILSRSVTGDSTGGVKQEKHISSLLQSENKIPFLGEDSATTVDIGKATPEDIKA